MRSIPWYTGRLCAIRSTLTHCASISPFLPPPFPFLRVSTPCCFPPAVLPSVPCYLSRLTPVLSPYSRSHTNKNVRRPLNKTIRPVETVDNEKEWLSVLGVILLLQESTPTCLRTTPAAGQSRAYLVEKRHPPGSAYVSRGYAEVGRVTLLPLCTRVGL